MNVIAWTIATYLALGSVFAAWFVVLGVGRIDAAAKSAHVAFRLLILPGSVLLWPALLRRCLVRAATQPHDGGLSR